MTRIRTIAALAATALSLGAAPAALAHTSTVGNASGTPSMNACLSLIDCTYVNYKGAHPTDVVTHGGRIVSWSVNADSINGYVELRVLRPVGGGKFKGVHTSASELVAVLGINTYSANIKVKAGDVISLENATSGGYMAAAPHRCIHYFGYGNPITDGMTGKPDQNLSHYRALLSATVSY
jgi:hypothetical protein